VKTNTLAVILSVLSLGGVVALYVKVDDLSGQIRRARSDRDAGDRKTADAGPPEYVIGKSAGRSDEPGALSAHDGMPSHASPGDRPAPAGTLEERLARLEQREEERALRGDADPGNGVVYRMPKFVRDVDDLAAQLKLSSTQKDRVQEAIRRGKARIDEILSIPGTDGKTIKEVRAERQRKLLAAMTNPEKNAGQMVALTLSGHSRLEERIPGRNETYRQELDRIKGETRNEIKGSLDADQGKKFDDLEVDHLLGGETDRFAISVGTTMVGEAIDDEGAAGSGSTSARSESAEKE